LVGTHRSTLELNEWCLRIAPTDIIPGIIGETGTGKRVVASLIHSLSGRSGLFVPRSPGEIPPGLVHAELYGHGVGAFTGAVRSRPGWFVEADQGSALIDEAREMSAEFQAALRDVLDGYGFQPVGLDRRVIPDVRFMVASRWPLRELVAQGKLQEDIYYRLCGWEIRLVPLRERREDIVPLIEHFLDEEARRRRDGPRVCCSAEVLEMMNDYDWPGNVRQLKRAVVGASQLAREGIIRLEHLPNDVVDCKAPAACSGLADASPREQTVHALRRSGGNVTQAADILNVTPTTVWRRARQFDIDLGEFRKGTQAG
jgi:DNA-binding NtrC family response regulator